MIEYGFKRRFHDLSHLEVAILIISWIHYELEGIITNFFTKPPNVSNLLYNKQDLDNH